MFFHISQQSQENYPCQWKLGSFAISTDNGWQHIAIGPVEILYKGYADSGPLESLLGQVMFQTVPHLTGSFCALVVVNNTLTIQTDRYRGFPIYIGQSDINNLVATDRTAWTDSLVTVHADLTVTENKFDVIGDIDDTTIDFQQAQDQVHDILTRKTRQFLSHNVLPLKVFLSGGVDTMLVYSYLRDANAEFELLDYTHFDHDYFWRSNSDKINQYWSYQQSHHWRDSCVLTSGALGDAFMLRHPINGDFYLRHQGTTINESVRSEHMQYDFIKLQQHQTGLKNQPALLPSKKELYHYLCDMMLNDWQHWHLGNTLHWTPLRDLDIAKIIMRLPLNHAINQMVNCEFSLGLIERNIPGGASLVSVKKDSGPTFKNLNGLFDH
jgi:hypothetical protein